MDQLKVVLAVLKKHHFWLLLGLAVLVGVGIWFSATSGLSGQFTKRKGELKGKYDAVKQLAGKANPPNDKCVEAVKQSHGVLKEEVLRAWQELFQDQQKSNPWPAELGDEFLVTVNNLKGDEEIPIQYRELYQTFIANHVKTLGDKIITARRPVVEEEEEVTTAKTAKPGEKGDPKAKKSKKTGTAGMPPGSMMPAMGPGTSSMPGLTGAAATTQEWNGLVDWDDEQALLDRFYWENPPSSQELRLAQEDLWVYEALLRVVARANEPAKTQYAAAVKRIYNLEIAQAAGVAFQSGTPSMGSGYGASMPGMMGPGSSSMPPGMSGYSPGGSSPSAVGSGPGSSSGGSMSPSSAAPTPGMPPGTSPGGMGMGMGMGTAMSPAQMLLNGRYVNQKGEPLTADAKPPFAEFKMMPVRMNLLVDQRRLPKLLAECANSSMPVEVRRVRLHPESGGVDLAGVFSSAGGYGSSPGMSGPPGMSSPMSSGSSPMMPPGGKMMGPSTSGSSGYMAKSGPKMGMSPGGMGKSSTPMGSGGTMSAPTTETPWDVPVEILGIIFIYNTPDRAKLGTGAATEAAAGAGTPSATPPGTPATPAPGTPATPAPGIPATPAPTPGGATPAAPPATP